MILPDAPIELSRVDSLAALRAQVATAEAGRGPALPFGIAALDDRLADRGLRRAALHEIAAASAALGDDAAATLFAAGLGARLAGGQSVVLWALTRFDLYAPGLEQAGLRPARVMYALGRNDKDVLALAEDGLRSRSLGCVVAEVKSADQIATRRLQLAAGDGNTPMLLYRRHRARDRCPLADPSAAATRWRIGARPSAALPYPGVGRGRWLVALARQRGGNPFSLELEACDEAGRLALPAAARDRAVAGLGTASRAA